MFHSSSDDDDFELKANDDNIPGMFRQAPLMRSIGLFESGQHDLNQERTRGAMGDVAFGGLTGSSGWGFEDPGNDFGRPTLEKDLDRPDWSQVKLMGADAGMYSRSNLVAQVAEQKPKQVVPLEPLPFFIEEYSSFVTKSTSADVIDALATIFGTMQVDADPYMHQHRMKGLAHNTTRSASVSFRVQIYRSETEGERVCEFQRRQGCVVTFHDLYRKSLEELGSHVLRPYRDVAGLTPVEVPASQVDLDSDTVKSLFSMASSRNADVQREGVGMLANLSSEPAAQLKLVQDHSSEAFQLLGEALCSKDEQVKRCASRLASNLCMQESFRGAACAQILTVMIKQLCTGECLNNRATKRNLGFTLATLSSTHCSQFPNDLECLKVHANSPSAELRGSIQECLNNHLAFKLAQKAV